MFENLTILNEPYVIGFIIALIFTGIYYLIQRMNKKSTIEQDDENKINKKNKKDSSLSNEMKSILIFISSFCLFTGTMYFYNNMKNPIQNISDNVYTVTDIATQIKEQVSDLLTSNKEAQSLEEKIIDEVLANENVDEIFSASPVEKKKKIHVDQEFIAGKKRSSSSKNKEYKHMLSKEAKYVDNDIDLNVSPF
jgi:hypothetical protein